MFVQPYLVTGMDAVIYFPCLLYLTCFHIPMSIGQETQGQREKQFAQSHMASEWDLALSMTPIDILDKYGQVKSMSMYY